MLGASPHVGRILGGLLGAALSTAAQGFRQNPLAWVVAAWGCTAIAAADLAPDWLPRTAEHLALFIGDRLHRGLVALFALCLARPHSLASLRGAGRRWLLPLPFRLARYLAFNLAFWALLLYSSDDVMAIEVYRIGKEEARESVGLFAWRLASWANGAALATWARDTVQSPFTGHAARPLPEVVRQAIHQAYGPFAQICVAFVAGRDGDVRQRFCATASDFDARSKPLRPHEAAKVLGVRSGASAADVRKAYRRLALKYHPDKLQTQSKRARAVAEREFLRVQEAYRLLTGKGDPP
mmetsp:Transcript_14602/g.49447  ORF Transcript_14602/g.49447 Transcript_14602/m.49447 type:complete len:296 (-) Transcript_14602:152-1039(-)